MARLLGRRAAPLIVWAAALPAACDRGGPGERDDRRPPASRLVPRDSTAYRAERLRDVTGDGLPERLTAVAVGLRDDSLTVRLAIESRANDSLLYAAQWRSADYFKYIGPPAALPADSVRRVVRRHLAALLADSAFAPARDPATEAAAGAVGHDFDAIRYDVAEHRFRAEHGLTHGEPLPPAAHTAIEQTVRTPAVTEQATALARELRGRPTFRYYAGAEETYAVAWSDRERRFVRVWGCC